MSNPKNPNDPDSLSLAPSGGDKKADFSNVQSGSGSTEADAPKADFSNVQSGSGSTEESIGEQTYTVQRGDTLSHVAKQFYGKARSEEHTSELQPLMRISYAVFCLKKKN